MHAAHMWDHLYKFDQDDFIDSHPELEGFQQGVCLGISMEWCRYINSNGPMGGFERTLSSLQVVNLINQAQIRPLQTFLQGFVFRDDFGNPHNVVAGNTAAQVNHLRAYDHRREALSSWARNSGFRLNNDWIDFPQGSDPTQFSNMMQNISGHQGQAGTGLIALGGQDVGHVVAFHNNGSNEFRYFDPNFGEYRTYSPEEFNRSIRQSFLENYPEYNQHLWITSFQKELSADSVNDPILVQVSDRDSKSYWKGQTPEKNNLDQIRSLGIQRTRFKASNAHKHFLK